MITAVVTEIPPQLEPTTEDAFERVAGSDDRRDSTRARIAELFGSEPRRAIVD